MPNRSPIASVPVELLTDIFEIGARTPMTVDPKFPSRPLFSKTGLDPLYTITVSHVCAQWREIALQTPVLWSYLCISRSAATHRRLKNDIGHSLEWIPFYLIRSVNLPLHITFDALTIPLSASNIIFPYTSRVKSITILVPHVGHLAGVLTAFKGVRVPEVTTLNIAADIYRENIISAQELPPFFVNSSPKLTSIALHGAYLNWGASPMTNLRMLELRFISRWPAFEELRRMFDASPRLQCLTVHDDIAAILRNVRQPDHKPVIQLRGLRHFEIIVQTFRESHNDIASMIGLFEMRGLESLVLRNIRSEEWMNVSTIYRISTPPHPASNPYGPASPYFPKLAILTVHITPPLTPRTSGPPYLG